MYEISEEGLGDLIFNRINEMINEVKHPNDEDADVCTDLIIKDLSMWKVNKK
jgi:hypothetical protein